MVCLPPLARIHVPVVRREVAKSRCGDAAVLFNDSELIRPLARSRAATQLINSVWNPCHGMMYGGKFDLEGRAPPVLPLFTLLLLLSSHGSSHLAFFEIHINSLVLHKLSPVCHLRALLGLRLQRHSRRLLARIHFLGKICSHSRATHTRLLCIWP